MSFVPSYIIETITKEDYKTLLNTKWQSKLDIIKYLVSKGFKLLGEGEYASVYGKSGVPYVVRLYHSGWNWEKWTRFVTNKGKTNKHFPKIYAIKNYKFDQPSPEDFQMQVSIAISERLERLTDSDMKQPPMENMGTFISFLKIYQGDMSIVEMMENDTLAKIILRKQDEIKSFLTDYPELAMAIVDIVKLFGSKTDLKKENFMKRHDGTIVINDPVVA